MQATGHRGSRDRALHAEHLRVGPLALVALGGAIGTGLRLALTAVLPGGGPLPLAVIVINLSGAFALGWLLEALRSPEPESPTRMAARLGIGTGVLGGYTTYSAFAVGTDGLLAMSDPVPGLLLSLATVVGGIVAAWCGSRAALLLRRRERDA
ncbi:fluoride efflux transporter FluC [Microbacterium timonense]|uniref:fluoride efflux transporter FluC n=1 Tax=Microbacterium timonense TaxID=2086576 RepID=UPI000D10914B|nr:CrcB family protein [Microbacterium timonense]